MLSELKDDHFEEEREKEEGYLYSGIKGKLGKLTLKFYFGIRLVGSIFFHFIYQFFFHGKDKKGGV